MAKNTPFSDITVLDFSRYLPGGYATQVLADLGATVIKVEPPYGDAQRTQGPGFGCEQTDMEDPTIDLNNTNKNFVSINLKNEEGMKFMKKLLADADIFVNNLRDKGQPRFRRSLLGCSWWRCKRFP